MIKIYSGENCHLIGKAKIYVFYSRKKHAEVEFLHDFFSHAYLSRIRFSQPALNIAWFMGSGFNAAKSLSCARVTMLGLNS